MLPVETERNSSPSEIQLAMTEKTDVGIGNQEAEDSIYKININIYEMNNKAYFKNIWILRAIFLRKSWWLDGETSYGCPEAGKALDEGVFHL